MFFLILSNAEINFLEEKLNWRLYINTEALSTTKQVELVDKKIFASIAIDLDDEIFIVHIASLISTNVYLSYRAQIALFLQHKAFSTVLSKYIDFTNIFSFNLATKL